MKTATVLRIAIVAEYILVALSVILSFTLEDSLPPPLRDYVKAEAEREITRSELLLMVPMLILIVAAVVASVGLFMLKEWARWCYLAATGGGSTLLVFMDPSVQHAVTEGVGNFTVIVSGVILGIVFFTDVLRTPPPENGTSDPMPQN